MPLFFVLFSLFFNCSATVVIDGKTYTVINAFSKEADETLDDKLRYLVKES